MSTLTRARIKVVFISGFPPEFTALRQWWLERHFGKYLQDQIPSIILTQSPGAQKAEQCRHQGVKHYIEDNIETAESIADAGIDSWLVPSTYMGTPSDKVRVGTVREFALHVARLEQTC